MEEYEDVIVLVRILKNKANENLEREGDCSEEEVNDKLSESKNIMEQKSEEDKTDNINDYFDSELDKKIKAKQRELTIRFLKEGYSVDKICNMLDLTYSQIEAIVNGEDF